MVLYPEDFDQYLIHYPCKHCTLKGCRMELEACFGELSVIPISGVFWSGSRVPSVQILQDLGSNH